MSITVDSSTPVLATNVASTQLITTASFSPPANTLLVAMYMGLEAYPVTSITNTGTSLSWSSLVTVLGPDSDADCEIWVAYNSASQSGITVTANWATSTPVALMALGLVVLNGAASTQNGPTVTAASYSGSNSLSITRNGNSAIGSFGIAATSLRTVSAQTPNGGCTDVFNGNTYQNNMTSGSSGSQIGLISSSATSDTTTAIALGSGSFSGEHTGVAAEILPGGGGGGPTLWTPQYGPAM